MVLVVHQVQTERAEAVVLLRHAPAAGDCFNAQTAPRNREATEGDDPDGELPQSGPDAAPARARFFLKKSSQSTERLPACNVYPYNGKRLR